MVGLLALLHVGFQIVAPVTGHNALYGVAPLFDLDAELSVPAFFSTALLLAAAALLGIIALVEHQARSPVARQWTALALTFCFHAVDEAASIHELLTRPTLQWMGRSSNDFLYFVWVVPGSAAVVAFGLCFVRFLLRLDLRTRWQCVVAGAIYVAGALGCESLGGRAFKLYGPHVAYQSLVVGEESCEMLATPSSPARPPPSSRSFGRFRSLSQKIFVAGPGLH